MRTKGFCSALLRCGEIKSLIAEKRDKNIHPREALIVSIGEAEAECRSTDLARASDPSIYYMWPGPWLYCKFTHISCHVVLHVVLLDPRCRA